MAYMTKENAAEIRNKIKAAFPAKAGFKFSIRVRHHSTICIAMLESPIAVDMKGRDHLNINNYYIREHHSDNPTLCKVLEKINEIANVGNFDKSDSQSDYFHVGWYVDLTVGRWDKPYKQVEKPRIRVAV